MTESSPPSKPKLQCHHLTLESPEPDIIQVLDLSRSVFNLPNLKLGVDPPHQRLSKWKDELAKEHAILIYATVANSPTISRSTESDGNTTTPDFNGQLRNEELKSELEPLGFFFGYPETMPEIGQPALHLWLAGVRPEARGMGVFPFLMDVLARHAKEKCHLDMLTVCTMPKIFTKMYKILCENGWEFVAWREDGQKVLMKLQL